MKTFFAVFLAIMASVAVVGFYLHSEKQYETWIEALDNRAKIVEYSAAEVFKNPTEKSAKKFSDDVALYREAIQKSGVYEKDRYGPDGSVRVAIDYVRSQLEKEAPEIVKFLPASY